jgi:hypothetical protein
MRASMIWHKGRVARIAHHYFYPPKSTMVTFPLMIFDKWRKEAKELRSRLAKILLTERAKGKKSFDQWHMGKPA